MKARLGRRVEFPNCPFCGMVIPRPAEVSGSELPGGVCRCGAAFVMDARGMNLGEALLEALSLACGGDADLGWQLEPGEDYEDRQLLGYEPNRHVIVGSATTFRSGMGALCFVRLVEGALERAAGRSGRV